MYRASIENRGDSKHYATTKNYHFVMDTEGQGAPPVETLLASLCACVGHYAREYLLAQGITYQAFTVTAQSSPTEDQMRLADIDVSIDMRDRRLDERQQAELFKYVERCKVYGTLKANSRIRIRLSSFEETLHEISPSR